MRILSGFRCLPILFLLCGYTVLSAQNDCASPHNLGSTLPINITGLTTCGTGNDYSIGDGCVAPTLLGEDYLFRLGVPADGCYTISLSNTSVNTGVMVMNGCPDSFPSCIGLEESASGNPSLDVFLQFGGAYTIVVASNNAANCTGFDINVAECPPDPGDDCTAPFVVPSFPFTQTGFTTCGAGDDYDNTMACGSDYMNGEDFTFEFNPASSGCHLIELANTGAFTGFHVFDGCPDAVGTNCVGFSTNTTGNPDLELPLSFGTTYYITVSTFPAPDCTAFDFSITACPPPAPGDDCSIPFVIGAVPFSQAGMTTCGADDDYDNTMACTSNYMNGEDYVIEFTAPSTDCFEFDLTNTGTWTGIHILDDCPDALFASCIATSTESGGNPTLQVPLTSGVTYTVVISTNPAPDCTAFDLAIDVCPPSPPGQDCATPYFIPSGIGYVENGMSTCGFGDDYDSGDACGSNYMDGDDFVFSFVPSFDTCYDVSASNTGNFTGIFVLDGCPDAVGTNCVENNTSSSGNPGLSTNLLAGQQYYIVVSTFPSPDCTAFDFDIGICPPPPVPANDCGIALLVCDNTNLDFNSFGSGNADFADPDNNQGCLSNVNPENQSSWFFVEIDAATAPGSDLGFTIDPNVPSDYDFAVWGPDVACDDLGNPIRCSWAAGTPPTGLGNGALDFSEGAGGDNWVAPLTVNPGEIYIVMIDNWANNSQGFELTWSGTAALSCNDPCPADVGTFAVTPQPGNVGTNFPSAGVTPEEYILCNGDRFEFTSNSDFLMPTAEAGEVAELMWALYTSLPPAIPDPSDPNFSGTLIADGDIDDINTLGIGSALPNGLALTNNTLWIIPVTADDGDGAGDPNGTIAIDSNADNCFDYGDPIAIVYLDTLDHTVNDECGGPAITITGGMAEFFPNTYALSNLIPVTAAFSNPTPDHNETFTITGIGPGDGYSFDVVDGNGCTYQINGSFDFVGMPPDLAPFNPLELCATTFDLASLIVTDFNASGGTLSYHANAGGVAGAVLGSTTVSADDTYWIISTLGSDPTACRDTTSIDLTLNDTPDLVMPADEFVCDSFDIGTVIPIDNNATGGTITYHADAGGSAGAVLASTTITSSGDYYIVSTVGIAPNTCADTTVVDISIVTSPDLVQPNAVVNCLNYDLSNTVPIDNNVAGGTITYHSDAGGSAGAELAGTLVSASSDYYIVSTVTSGPISCADTTFVDVTISPAPNVDDLPNQSACGNFVFPVITGSNLTGSEAYYTAANGGGTQYLPGDNISASTGIFIYDGSGACSDEESFVVNIITGPDLAMPAAQGGCNTFDLSTVIPVDNNSTGGTMTYYLDGGGIPGAELTGAALIVNTSDTYYIISTSGVVPNQCMDTTTVVVTIGSPPDVDDLADVTVCDSYTLPVITGTNLTGNEAYYTASGGGGIQYDAGDAINVSTPLFIYDGTIGCNDEESVIINIVTTPDLMMPNPVSGCNSFDITTVTPIDNNATGGVITYYTDGGGVPGSLLSGAGLIVNTNGTYYIIMSNGSAPTICRDTTTVAVTITLPPTVDDLPDTKVCDAYILPAITGTNLTGNEAYYSGTNGTGTQYAAGDAITASSNVFIYDGVSGCDDEEVFNISIVISPDLVDPNPVVECNSFDISSVVPVDNNATSGSLTYYNDGGGVAGTQLTGAALNVTTSGTYYIVSGVNSPPIVCPDTATISITITPAPDVDDLADVMACGDYTLPVITGTNLSGNEAYFTAPSGSGPQFNAGDIISADITLFIYDGVLGCDDDESVDITITAQPDLVAPANESACNSFDLSAIVPSDNNSAGGTLTYHADGGGVAGAELTGAALILSSTSTYYIISTVGTAPNTCSDTTSLMITITPAPDVDDLADVSVCGSYTLPAITGTNLTGNEAYFTVTNGGGTQYNAGDNVSADVTLFIYDGVIGCDDEETVDITITAQPDLVAPPAASNCNSFDLSLIAPVDNNSAGGTLTYHADGGGVAGAELTGAALTVNTSATYYIISTVGVAPNLCSDTTSLMLTITLAPDVDDLGDVSVCGDYTLPAITGTNLTGNEAYFTATNGGGTQYNAGDVISATTNLFIYDGVVGCDDEETVSISITGSPDLVQPTDETACDSFDLSSIVPVDNNSAGGTISYYDDGGGVPGSLLTGANLSITSSGVYYIISTVGVAPNTCADTTFVNVSIQITPNLQPLAPVTACDSYDISTTTVFDLNNAFGTIAYHQDGGGTAGAALGSNNITTSGIYYLVSTVGSGANTCSDEVSINITITSSPDLQPLNPITVCDSYNLVNLNVVDANASGGILSYHSDNAGSAGGFLGSTTVTTTDTYWVVSTVGAGVSACRDSVSVQVNVNASPDLQPTAPVVSCVNYELTNTTIFDVNSSGGAISYHADGGGVAGAVLPNTLVNTSGTYYVVSVVGVAPNECSDTTTINVTINPNPDLQALTSVEVCDSYNLLNLNVIDANATGGTLSYHSDNGGSAGGFLPSTTVTNSDTYWIVSSVGSSPNICRDTVSVLITINVSPDLQALAPIVACESYDLSDLSIVDGNSTGGNISYHSESSPGVAGVQLPNTIVNSSDTYYVISQTGVAPNICADTVSVAVTINLNPDLQAIAAIIECDSYDLEDLNVIGNNSTGGTLTYHQDNAGSAGGFLASTVITNSDTYWIVSSIGINPNICRDSVSVSVSINASPDLQAIAPIVSCDTYNLDDLTIVDANATGASIAFHQDAGGSAGAVLASTSISTDQTVYIVATAGVVPNICADTTAVSISITQSPDLMPLADVDACDNYDLANLSITDNNSAGGTITYHQDNAGSAGVELLNTNINTGGTYFVISTVGVAPNICSDTISVVVNIQQLPDLQAIADISVCDAFDLSDLNIADNNSTGGTITYHTDAGGTAGAVLGSTIVSQTELIFIVSTVGVAPNTCSDTINVNISIDTTPDLADPAPIAQCGDYDLTNLSIIDNNNAGGNITFHQDAFGVPGAELASSIISATGTNLIWLISSTGVAPNICSDTSSVEITLNCNCPTVTNAAAGAESLCEGSSPDLVTTEATITYDDLDGQFNSIVWFTDAGLSNPVPVGFTVSHVGAACETSLLTLYAGIICNSDPNPVAAGEHTVTVYPVPTTVTQQGGCSIAAIDNCGGLLTIEYEDPVGSNNWTTTVPDGTGAGGTIITNDASQWRAYIPGAPAGCEQTGSSVATCTGCPTVTASANYMESLCVGGMPDLAVAEAAIAIDDPNSQFLGISWFTDAALSNAVPAGYSVTHTGEPCETSSTVLYAGIMCSSDPNPIPAGTFTITVFPAATTAAAVGGCSLEVEDNCAFGSLIIEYFDTNTSTWVVSPPAGGIVNNDAIDWRAYIAGTPDLDANGTPDCMQNGTAVAICNDCPSVANALAANVDLCEGDAPDFANLENGVVFNDPNSQFGGYGWYLDPGLTLAVPAGYFTVHNGNPCESSNTILYLGLTCLSATPVPAGSVNITVYPVSTTASAQGGCSLEVNDNCGGLGSLIIEYSTDGGLNWQANAPSNPTNGDMADWRASLSGAPVGCEQTGTVVAACEDCPTVANAIAEQYAFCEGDSPDFAAAELALIFNDPNGQFGGVQWYANAALSVPVNTATFAASHTGSCMMETMTVYAGLICNSDPIPISAGSIVMEVYPTPTQAIASGGCDLAVTDNCIGGFLIVQYSTDGGTTWSTNVPDGSGAGGMVINGDTTDWRAFVANTPDNDGDGNPDCFQSGNIVASCDDCPTVTNSADNNQILCEEEAIDFVGAEATILFDDPNAQFDGISWYFDASLLNPVPVGYTAAHSGSCQLENITLYAGINCLSDINSIAAGTITLEVYPIPTSAAPIGGCSLEVQDNCFGGGSLNIEYSNDGGLTWNNAAPASPNNGDMIDWRALVNGAPVGCEQSGTVVASCTGCPTITNSASLIADFCDSALPDFATAEAQITFNDPNVQFTGLAWYTDAILTQAVAAGYIANYSGNGCEVETVQLFAGLLCSSDPNPIAAGTITLNLYPTPTTPAPIGGCSLEVSDNCLGNSDIIIEYSTDGGATWLADAPTNPSSGDMLDWQAYVSGAPLGCVQTGTATALCTGCPTVLSSANTAETLCEGGIPDFAAANAQITVDDPNAQFVEILWYQDPALLNEINVATYSVSHSGDCIMEQTTLFAGIICLSDPNPIAGGTITIDVYPTPDDAVAVGGCSLEVTDNCINGNLLIEYSQDGGTTWSTTIPSNGSTIDGETTDWRAYVTGTPDADANGVPDCIQTGSVVAVCTDCPTIDNAVGGIVDVCEGDAIDIAAATAIISVNDPNGQYDGINWYFDAALLTPVPAGYAATHTGSCAMESSTLFAGVICLSDPTPIAAGTLTINVYPTPTSAAPIGGCSLAVQDNCVGGANLTIEYSLDGGATWLPDPPANPNNGDMADWRAYVLGAPAGCEQTGAVAASCTGCPTITNAAAEANDFCDGAIPDFATAEASITIDDPNAQFSGYTWFTDAALTNPVPAGYAANYSGNGCEVEVVQLYAGLICSSDANPIAAGTISLSIYPTPSTPAWVGGCSLDVQDNCVGNSDIIIEYSTDGGATWTGSAPAAPNNGDAIDWRAYVTDAPAGCEQMGTAIASCTGCPTVNNAAAVANDFCDSAIPDFAAAEASITIDDPNAQFNGYTWYLDAALTNPIPAGYAANYSGNGCEVEVVQIFAGLICSSDVNPIAAGSITMNLYPTPTTPAWVGGCSLDVQDNCVGNSDIVIEYSSDAGATWTASAPASPNNGDMVDWRAYVLGAPAGCEQTGTAVASCTGCPTVTNAAADVVDFCDSGIPDFAAAEAQITIDDPNGQFTAYTWYTDAALTAPILDGVAVDYTGDNCSAETIQLYAGLICSSDLNPIAAGTITITLYPSTINLTEVAGCNLAVANDCIDNSNLLVEYSLDAGASWNVGYDAGPAAANGATADFRASVVGAPIGCENTLTVTAENCLVSCPTVVAATGNLILCNNEIPDLSASGYAIDTDVDGTALDLDLFLNGDETTGVAYTMGDALSTLNDCQSETHSINYYLQCDSNDNGAWDGTAGGDTYIAAGSVSVDVFPAPPALSENIGCVLAVSDNCIDNVNLVIEYFDGAGWQAGIDAGAASADGQTMNFRAYVLGAPDNDGDGTPDCLTELTVEAEDCPVSCPMVNDASGSIDICSGDAPDLSGSGYSIISDPDGTALALDLYLGDDPNVDALYTEGTALNALSECEAELIEIYYLLQCDANNNGVWDGVAGSDVYIIAGNVLVNVYPEPTTAAPAAEECSLIVEDNCPSGTLIIEYDDGSGVWNAVPNASPVLGDQLFWRAYLENAPVGCEQTGTVVAICDDCLTLDEGVFKNLSLCDGGRPDLDAELAEITYNDPNAQYAGAEWYFDAELSTVVPLNYQVSHTGDDCRASSEELFAGLLCLSDMDNPIPAGTLFIEVYPTELPIVRADEECSVRMIDECESGDVVLEYNNGDGVWTIDPMEDVIDGQAADWRAYVLGTPDNNDDGTPDCIEQGTVVAFCPPNTTMIPTAFSPNNDGMNDEFRVEGYNILSVQMQVWDRWGVKYFETNDPSTGWDGTYKGINVDVGVYVFIINITYTDGESEMIKGNVTVIR